MKQEKEIELKVAASSNPSSVAGSIVKNIQEGKTVRLVSVGAGAVNQMVKAYSIARGYAAPSGMDLLLKGGFTDIEINDNKKTGIKMTVVVM
jgi:stage V sporulation protein S